MIANKRVFIAFAMEDKTFRSFLVGHSLHPNSPFEFVDMSVKEPWDEAWKTKCRTRIKGCDGVIALVSENTAKASGQLWEIKCAYDEEIPTMLIYVNDERPMLPSLIENKRISVWNWSNIEKFVDRI